MIPSSANQSFVSTSRTLLGHRERPVPLRRREIFQVQAQYNLSVPNEIFSHLRLPTVPQSQRDTFIQSAVNRRVPGSSPGRGANPFNLELAALLMQS
jgi:hypothetical protein